MMYSNSNSNNTTTTTVDMDALNELIEEFGGLAGWKAKKDNNEVWTQDVWEENIARLYENRHDLDGIEEPRRRGKAALDAMSPSPKESIERLTRRISERRNQENER